MTNCTELNPPIPQFSHFGATFIGPLLSFFSNKLATYSQQKNDKLFFLAREGYWLQQAYSEHCSSQEITPNSEYLLVSRAFMFKVMLDDPRSYAYSLDFSFDGSLKELLRTRFMLSNATVSSFFTEKELNKVISLPNDIADVETLLTTQQSKLSQIIAPTKRAYLAYLAELGMFELETINFVDVGYSGTIQKLMTILLDKPTIGHYLIASKPGAIKVENRQANMIGYLKEGKKMGEGYTPLDRSMFLEAILTAPQGQFQDIRINQINGKGYDFYFGRKVSAQKHFHDLTQIMNGAISFVSTASKNAIEYRHDEVEKLLTQYVEKPNMIPRSSHHLFAIDDDVTGNGTVDALQFFGLK
ncbi:HAD family hydrolase [Shewanella sp. 6_MG-2023]|uniref:HAD family hydrolase n=1 Tax=Shewanella sp. 6_MG-2023 TaxID=3062660 RepID=UPI0026E33FBC|nr:HAD family hydrolase [Shewanella sp. 6_MG-2023]MDO6617646.1 HAD family hydrolase [Shewanella sp. 6_MG-2023]